jgi:type VI secretion system protein ImpI
MYLTLEVISGNAPAGSRRKVFTVDGGKIGRAPENDMVLTGVGVHRHHATVRFINGVFFIEGVGTNGIAVNNAEAVLPRNEPYPLKTGDKVFIDEFEVSIGVSVQPPPEAAAPRAAAPPARPAARAPVEPILEADDLDPLNQLSAPPARVQARPPPTSEWNQTSSLNDQFTPPAPSAPPLGGGQAIPENWDMTSFDRSKLQPQAPAPRAMPPQPSSPVQRAAPPPQRPAPPAQRPPAAPRAPAPAAAGGNFEWDAFLRAAGVDPAQVPDDTADVLGHIMRIVVQGLIEVLRARSEIKSQFRMPLTQVKVSENNPLKFAANAESALNTLFGKQNPAYLRPREAFDDAFNDVRFHQLAMLAGVRAGFDNLMQRFEPEVLQESFDKLAKRGLFGGGAKYWEMYGERYREMVADSDETFRRLFGEEFARAYEQQLAVLKRTRGGAQR